MKKQKKFLDMTTHEKEQRLSDFGGDGAQKRFTATLFSRGKKTDSFFTEDSKLYITPREQKMISSGAALDREIKKWDTISSRVVKKFVRYQPSQASLLLEMLERRYEALDNASSEAAKSFLGQFSAIRLWNASIVGSILFGMVLMTFVYRYLGQGASAKQIDQGTAVAQQVVHGNGATLGVADTGSDAESFARQVAEIEQIKSSQSLEAEIKNMVKGYPIEAMVPYIAKQDRTVAAFIIAIAKKESDWGKHVPILNGDDCYNYWGYRGQRKAMGTGGHTCFDSAKDAVETVGKRLTTLVEENGRDTPQKMVLWKCGSSCAATGGQAAANKWISDVTMYFDKIQPKD